MMSGTRRAGRKTETAGRQKALILWPFADFVANDDVDGLFEYLAHCGIDLRGATRFDGLRDVILLHYQVGARRYDIDRAANDLRRWPSVAARIKELQEDKATQT